MKVKFLPQNVEFEIKPGESVMHVAQDHGLYIKSVCKGVPSCAECRVRVLDGEHNVLPPASDELSLIGTGHFIDRRRLSCQLKCFGDISVDMTEQIAKENGVLVGRKKKLAIKDDRVEQAVARRSEEPGDSEETPEAGDPLSAPAEAGPQSQSRRDSRSGAGDRGPRSSDRRPRENRGASNQTQSPSRPGGSSEPQQRRSPQPSSAQSPAHSQDSGGEGGGKRRRRRRGKGQGQSQGQGQGPSAGPNSAPKAGPSRPQSSGHS